MTQTEALIDAIAKNPGISRSELIDLRVDGFRIANVTARITDARKELASAGKTLRCTELPRENGHRRTTYEIVEAETS